MCQACDTPALHQAGWLVCSVKMWCSDRPVQAGLCLTSRCARQRHRPSSQGAVAGKCDSPLRQQPQHSMQYVPSRQSSLFTRRLSRGSMHIEPELDSRHVQPQRRAAQALGALPQAIEPHVNRISTPGCLLSSRHTMLPQRLGLSNRCAP